MKMIHGREPGKPSKRSATVTGEMWGDQLLDGGDVVINTVFFAPGARTHWHRHEGLQVLMVTQGKGFVRTADGETVHAVAGDIVYCPPGETHWHGAASDTIFQHTAFTIGGTEWFEPVDDDDYEAAEET